MVYPLADLRVRSPDIRQTWTLLWSGHTHASHTCNSNTSWREAVCDSHSEEQRCSQSYHHLYGKHWLCHSWEGRLALQKVSVVWCLVDLCWSDARLWLAEARRSEQEAGSDFLCVGLAVTGSCYKSHCHMVGWGSSAVCPFLYWLFG